MKKENKIVRQAKWARDNGYTHIATIVKNYRDSNYYNVQPINTVLSNGRWKGARIQQYNGWVGKVGIISSQIDWNTTIMRAELPRDI